MFRRANSLPSVAFVLTLVPALALGLGCEPPPNAWGPDHADEGREVEAEELGPPMAYPKGGDGTVPETEAPEKTAKPDQETPEADPKGGDAESDDEG